MFGYAALRAVARVAQTGSFERAVPCVAPIERGEWLRRRLEHVGRLEKALMQRLPGLVDPGAPRPQAALARASPPLTHLKPRDFPASYEFCGAANM